MLTKPFFTKFFRTQAVREDGRRWNYGYNSKGELTSGVKRFADGSPLPAHTFAYDYDGIGNLITSSQSTGRAANPASTVSYQANETNQYTNILTPGNYTILAEVPPGQDTSLVTLNGQAVPRWENTVWKNFNVNNGTEPVVTTNVFGTQSTTITGDTLLPQQSILPSYDFDGNITNDGIWSYEWDAENRLASMTMNPYNNYTPYKLDFAYDSMNRRISKNVSILNGNTFIPFLISRTRFLYDGWNLIAEYDLGTTGNTFNLLRTHLWGLDLSGTLQGAGGVGGLLSTTLVSNSNSYYPTYDGNGNITAWLDGSGAMLDKRDYDPFGALLTQYKLTATPSILDELPFGFSTKYTDKESDLLYYGHRYYNTRNKRWLNRDLIGERGGVNLYGFVGNDGVGKWDHLGKFGNWSGVFKWAFDASSKTDNLKIIDWNDFDPHGSVRNRLKSIYADSAFPELKKICGNLKPGETKETALNIEHNLFGRGDNVINTQTTWIGAYDVKVKSAVLMVNATVVKKMCDKCDAKTKIEYHALDTSDFNPGEIFEIPGTTVELPDDLFVWIRDWSIIGYDYQIFAYQNGDIEWKDFYEN